MGSKADEEEKLSSEQVDEFGVDEPPTERLSDIRKTVSIEDFETKQRLGQGAYGQVNLVSCIINDQDYALKILDKARVAKFDKVESVMREKDNMFELREHPNICSLELTFQDESSLFFLLEYC